MPQQSGLDFQRSMQLLGIGLPVIFITGHGDVPMSVQAMKNGAIEFLTKPFRDQDLLDAIQQAVALMSSAVHSSSLIRPCWRSGRRSRQESRPWCVVWWPGS